MYRETLQNLEMPILEFASLKQAINLDPSMTGISMTEEERHDRKNLT